MANRQTLEGQSDLSQFRATEDARCHTLSQQLAQLKIDQVAALETKAHESEFNQFHAWRTRKAASATTARKVALTMAHTVPTYQDIAIIEPPTYDLLSPETQFTHAIMTTALWMKGDKVSLAVECYDDIHYKLSWINITNIDQLMTEIRTNRINLSPRNVHEFGFNRSPIFKIKVFAGEAKRIPAVSYTTPLREVFHLNETNDVNELDYSNTTTDILQEVLLTVSFNMMKLFPIRWTNEVFHKFLLSNVKSPDVLLHHIIDETLNPKLKANNYLSINNTTHQILARASTYFAIDRMHNVNTAFNGITWAIRKKVRCLNYNTVGCDR